MVVNVKDEENSENSFKKTLWLSFLISVLLISGFSMINVNAQEDKIISDVPEKCDLSSQDVIVESTAVLQSCDTLKGDKITVEKGSDLGSTALSANNDVRLGEEVIMNGGISSQQGNIKISENSEVKGGLTAGEGDIIMEEDNRIFGDLSAGEGNIEAEFNVRLEGDIDANGDVDIEQDSVIVGDLDSGTGDVEISPNSRIFGDISVGEGDLAIDGRSRVDGDISVGEGEFELGDRSSVEGDVDASKQIEVNRKTTIEGDVNSGSSNVVLKQNTSVRGDVDPSGVIEVAKSADIEGDYSKGKTVELEEPLFNLSIVEIPNEVRQGERFDIKYRADNEGGLKDTQSLEFRVNGELQNDRPLVLDPIDIEKDSFDYKPDSDDAPNIELSLQVDDDIVTRNITVNAKDSDPIEFEEEVIAVAGSTSSSFQSDDLTITEPNRVAVTSHSGYSNIRSIASDQTGEGYLVATEDSIISIDYDELGLFDRFTEDNANYIIEDGIIGVDDIDTSTNGDVVIVLSSNLVQAYSTDTQELLWEEPYDFADQPVDIVATSDSVYTMQELGNVKQLDLNTGETVRNVVLPTDGIVKSFDLSERSEKLAYIDDGTRKPKIATLDQLENGNSEDLEEIYTPNSRGFYPPQPDDGGVSVGPDGFVAATMFGEEQFTRSGTEREQGYAVYDDIGNQLYSVKKTHDTNSADREQYLRGQIEISRSGQDVYLGGTTGGSRFADGVIERLDKTSGFRSYITTRSDSVEDMSVLAKGEVSD